MLEPAAFELRERDGDIAVSGDRIRFTISVSEDEYFARPVPLRYRGAERVPGDEHEPWTHSIRADPRQYHGIVNADSIVLDVDGRERLFVRVEID